jgi:hypothetical protein
MATTTGADSLGADLKWLNKPEKFKNIVEHWTHWKYSMVNFLALVNSSYPDVLEQVERQQSIVTIDKGRDPELYDRARQLYSILTSFFLPGKCLNIAILIRERNGWELWRRLHLEFEPCIPNRSLALLQAIMRPDKIFAVDDNGFEDAL